MWLVVPILLIGAFAAQLALPRVANNPTFFWTVAAITSLMLIGLALFARRGRTLGLEFSLKKAHVGQTFVHLTVYTYWAMNWSDVGRQMPHIIGQVCFLTVVEILGSWGLNRRHRLGMATVPIVFSTNLFMWFRDDWFYFQYMMLVFSWLTKEFVKWERGGRRVHIFNPSAISLAIMAYVLIGMGRTDIVRAQEISQTLGYGPWCYESAFMAGLIIMSLVPVTAMTMGSALTMLGLGWVWAQTTGTLHFIDTSIPIAVFLGMNLLATDPVTIPRGAFGRLLAGILYGAAVFFTYDLLKHFGRPASGDQAAVTVTYFDKLLFVPILNLLARVLDRLADAITRRVQAPGWLRSNWVHMGVWAGVFVLLVRPATREHPGRIAETWLAPCEAGDGLACIRYLDLSMRDCGLGVAAGCHNAAIQFEKAGAAANAAVAFRQACDSGIAPACEALGARIAAGQVAGRSPAEGLVLLERACESTPEACDRAAKAAAPTDAAQARGLAKRGCDSGHAAACGTLGILLLQGQGGDRDPATAAPLLERACGEGVGAACANLAVMYRRGEGVPADPARAEALRQKACDAGLTAACEWKSP